MKYNRIVHFEKTILIMRKEAGFLKGSRKRVV